MSTQQFIELSPHFFIRPRYKDAFNRMGLTSIDAVFSFNAGRNLDKPGLPQFRTRLQFQTEQPPATLFLKRYDKPPVALQLRNWFHCRCRTACARTDAAAAAKLSAAGINTPETIAYGRQWGTIFEKRSFIVTEKIPNAESLERKLPDCFQKPCSSENLALRKKFITRLADFVRNFHNTRYRHRDLYLSHVFYDDAGRIFYLIDLARAFQPLIFAERFRIKDIAQLYYSAPARFFSRTDRLRFYLAYAARRTLTHADKRFISKVVQKARRIARHDAKHGRTAPFAD